MTVDSKEVGAITRVRKPNFLKAAGLGIASCLVVMVGTIIWAEVIGPPELGEQGPPFLGMIAGLVVFSKGTVFVKDKTIQFEGKSDSEIQKILENLSKKARVKNTLRSQE